MLAALTTCDHLLAPDFNPIEQVWSKVKDRSCPPAASISSRTPATPLNASFNALPARMTELANVIKDGLDQTFCWN
jgi:hypothetical protein